MNRRVLLKCAFFLVPLLLCCPSSGFAEEAKISVPEHLFYPPESKGKIFEGKSACCFRPLGGPASRGICTVNNGQSPFILAVEPHRSYDF